ncbi:MAG TPA: nucleoside phosphorylase [Ktedonobacteraceae bacterium]|nr:nucleoside phosphorylase [Ktedonobacteraceae bacterium]
MDISREYPLLEFDADRQAMLEPHARAKVENVPTHAVACFFQDVISTLIEQHDAKLLCEWDMEMGKHSVYEITFQDQRLAVFQPGMGAPLAAGNLEEMIGLGIRACIACGGAGVLDNSINVGEVVVPYAAVRDEGTSYHYLPPAREVEANSEVLAIIKNVLQAHEVPHLLTKTWTTDALYRETRAKIQQRKAEGCQVVEMEAASFFAVTQFRGIKFGQLLYGGDDVGSDEWSNRKWRTHTIRERLFWLAAEACLQVP